MWKNYLKQINVKRIISANTIPPKLIKLKGGILAKPLALAINCSFNQGVFPDKPSIVIVVPLDKDKPNKNDILNYRPVSISNTFSKIYENVINKHLVSYREKYFSPMLAYKKGIVLSMSLSVC